MRSNWRRLMMGPIDVRGSVGPPTSSSRARATKRCDERVVNVVVHDDPIDRDAHLTLMQELADHGGVDGAVEVDVLGHDQRAVPAELEHRPLDRSSSASASSTDVTADLGRARERHHARHRMRDEDIADLGRASDDDAQHARRAVPPPRRASRSSSPPVIGVSADGLTTTALPSASAGATDRMLRCSGQFHGLITDDHADRQAIDQVLLAG